MNIRQSSVKLLVICLSLLMLLTALFPTVYASVDQSLLPSGYQRTGEYTYSALGGITERHFSVNNSFGTDQIQCSVLEVDFSEPSLSLVASYNNGNTKKWNTTTLLEQAKTFEQQRGVTVVGGINADFFVPNKKTIEPYGRPKGALVMDGTVIRKTAWNRAFFAVTKNGEFEIRTPGSSMGNVQQAVGGGIILVKDGVNTSKNCKVNRLHRSEDTEIHPRSAIGIKADNTLVFFVADGRQAPYSSGMTLEQVADAMIALGCVDALELDGGSSSTLVSRQETDNELKIRNSCCYNGEGGRPIGSTLLICSTVNPTGVFDHAVFAQSSYYLMPGETVNLDVSGADENGYATELPEGGGFKLTDETYGVLTGNCFIAADQIGTVTVNYLIGDEVYGSATIEIAEEIAYETPSNSNNNKTFANRFLSFINSIVDFFNNLFRSVAHC